MGLTADTMVRRSTSKPLPVQMRAIAAFFTVFYTMLSAGLLVFGGVSDPLMKSLLFQLVMSTVAVWWIRARWSNRLLPGSKPMLLIVIGVLCGVPAIVVLGRLLY
jgi:hypothetical protein